MAREKAERGDTLSSHTQNSMRKKTFKSSYRDDDDDYMGSKGGFGGRLGGEVNMNEPPEPEVLRSILHRRTKK